MSKVLELRALIGLKVGDGETDLVDETAGAKTVNEEAKNAVGEAVGDIRLKVTIEVEVVVNVTGAR